MTSVITGDIINSKKSRTASWIKVLKKELGRWGDTPKQWEIFRGDSFQLEVKDTTQVLAIAIQLKAALRTLPGIDVRIAIGIGDKTYNAKVITESNGSAFVHSGELVEELKELKVNMAIRSGHNNFDKEMNLYLKLALVIMDGWTTNSAKTVYTAMLYPAKSQEELGKLLKVKQNAVSTRLKRACYYEIKEVIEMYQTKITEV